MPKRAVTLARNTQGKICQALDLRSEHMTHLGQHLHIADASSAPTLFLEASDREVGRYHTPSSQYSRLSRLVLRAGAKHVFIDNGSSTFAANEIQRHAVDEFIRSLRSIGTQTHAGVVLAVHVDKATARGDEGRGARPSEAYSGSSQWHNACRSRLYLRSVPDVEGELILTHGKSNHGPLAPDIPLVRTPDGLIVAVDQGAFVQRANTVIAERIEILLRTIEGLTKEGVNVPTATFGGNTAHKTLEGVPSYPATWKSKDTNRLITEAQRAGKIKKETYRTPQRKEAQRWVCVA